jgi:hypothetical protein
MEENSYLGLRAIFIACQPSSSKDHVASPGELDLSHRRRCAGASNPHRALAGIEATVPFLGRGPLAGWQTGTAAGKGLCSR